MGQDVTATFCFGQDLGMPIKGDDPPSLEEIERRLLGSERLQYTTYGSYYDEDCIGIILIVKGTATTSYDYGCKAVELPDISKHYLDDTKQEALERGFDNFDPRWLVAGCLS